MGHDEKYISEKSEESRIESQEDLDISVRLANPLRIFSRDQLVERATKFAGQCERPDLADTFVKGALVAAHPGRR